MTNRNCAKCNQEFKPTAKAGRGFSYCKKCCSIKRKEDWILNKNKIAKNNRNSFIKCKYNITNEIYEDLLKNQNGKCDICKTNEPQAIDHCHKTGKTRGLLCRACNTALGMFKDSTDVLAEAILYLKKHEK